MRYTKIPRLVTFLVFTIILSACNFGQQPEPTQDVGLIFTSAAETVSAQFNAGLTQTAQAIPTATIPPSATPIPTFAVNGTSANGFATLLTTPFSPLGTPFSTVTPLGALATPSGPLCNDSSYDPATVDQTYPDGAEIKAGEAFEKIWQIKNTGTCTWDDGYSFVHVAGEAMGGQTWNITTRADFVEPGKTKNIAIDMVAPSTKGEHGGCWKMLGDNGYYFGTFLCVSIVVK